MDRRQRAHHEHRRRHPRREHRRVHERPLPIHHRRLHEPVLGFSPSLPWDRSEQTWNIATTVTKLVRSHTVKMGGEWRHNRDILLQTQDAGGSRGQFNFNASGTGLPADASSLTGVANSLASFLLDWPNGVSRDLKVIDEPGTKHSAVSLSHRTSGRRRPNITIDLGLRWEYYTPLTGVEGAGQPVELRSGHQHAARLGLRQHQRVRERQEHVVEHQRAHRHFLAPQQRHGCARGLRWQHDSVPRQPVCVQLPGQAELLGNGAERVPGRRDRWPPASRRRRS